MQLLTGGVIPGNNPLFNKSTAATLDATYGGQNGYMMRLGLLGPDGKTMSEFVNATPYVKRDLIPVLLYGPSGAKYTPDPKKFVSMLKSIIEEQSTSIDGIDLEITVDSESRTIGKSEQFFVPVKTKKNVCEPTHNITDINNRTIQQFIEYYIWFLIGDPNGNSSNRPAISTYLTDEDIDTYSYLADRYSFGVLYIEPDITQRRVVNAVLCVNMYFQGGGSNTMRRNVTEGGELSQLALSFTPLSSSNTTPIMKMAQNVLNSMGVLSKIPDLDMLAPVDGVSPDVADLTGVGFDR